MDVRTLTPFLWAFEEGNFILEFYERVSRARMHVSYIWPGEVAQDMSLGLSEDIFVFTQQFVSWVSNGRKAKKLVTNQLWNRKKNIKKWDSILQTFSSDLFSYLIAWRNKSFLTTTSIVSISKSFFNVLVTILKKSRTFLKKRKSNSVSFDM